MTAIVLQADAAHLPLPDESVDLIVTSPPYFALRSYQDGGEHYAGQIGSEATPQEFLEALWACTREWCRVLKPTGSLFVNLGDKYSTYESRPGRAASHEWAQKSQQAERYTRNAPERYGIPYKSLFGLPWRYALGCIDELELLLRAEVIWAKPNGLPESVTDRVRRSHEQWFHFTRSPRYFAAIDELRTPASGYERAPAIRRTPGGQRGRAMSDTCNPLGAVPASVWEIPTESLKVPEHLGVEHFAAFPTEWPRRLILGWSPPGICTACGEGRRPMSVTTITADRGGRQFNPASGNVGVLGKERETAITGYACACPDTSAPTRPSVVVDPFGGTGTTAAVASALGRIGISVDLSHDYCRLARWRTSDPATRAKIRGERPPAKQIAGQLGMFEDVA